MDHRKEQAERVVAAIVGDIRSKLSLLRRAWYEYDDETQAVIRAQWVELVAKALPSPEEEQFNRAVDEATEATKR